MCKSQWKTCLEFTRDTQDSPVQSHENQNLKDVPSLDKLLKDTDLLLDKALEPSETQFERTQVDSQEQNPKSQNLAESPGLHVKDTDLLLGAVQSPAETHFDELLPETQGNETLKESPDFDSKDTDLLLERVSENRQKYALRSVLPEKL